MYILQRSLPLVASPVYSHTHTQPFIRFYSRLSRSAFISPLSVGVIRRQNGAFMYQGDYNATPGLLHSRLMSTETKNSPASPNNEGKTPTTVTDTAKQVSTTEAPQPPAKQQDKEGVSAFVKKWDVKIRKVANHYWLGTKLLSKNVAITTKLLRAVMNGHTMTRRERRLLVQTSADILRMIPFVIIVVVPFMEFALPVLLKLFPNMLPSTYEWKSEKEEHRAKRLKVNLEMAKFLNETMTEVSVDMKKANALDAQAFTDVMEKVKHDQKVTNKDILKVAQLFQDEFTLDKISREQLLAMNNYLGGSSLPGKWMSTDFIRTRLLNKIDKIKQDDKLIRREGLDALSMEELVDASLVRGMKVEGLNRKRIQQQLNEWLELSQNQNVPASLLILSRAFMITQTIRPEEALEDTLAHIPAEAVEEVKRDLPRAEEERARERLAELDKEKELIEKAVKEEQQEKKKLEKEKKEKKEEKKPVAPAEKPHIPAVGQENLIDLEETKRVLAAAAEVADEQEKEIIQDIEQDIEEIKKKQEIIEDVLEELPKETLEGDKRPKVLAEKLKDIIEDIEEEIEKMEKEHEEDKGKAEKADKEKKDTKTETK